MLRQLSACMAVAVLAAFMQPNAAADSKLYRYRNGEGVIVVDYTLPPEFAGQGYDILNSHGRLIETVEPQAAVAEDTLSPELQQAQEREDNYILSSYRSVNEIETAGKRKLEMLGREIEVLESNIRSAENRRLAEQERAANYERSGRPVPESLLRVLRELEIQLQQAGDLLGKRRQEFAETEKQYAWYAKRFRALTGTASEKAPETAVETDHANWLSVRD